MGIKEKAVSLPWDIVEKSIAAEIKWLKETILEFSYKEEKEICSDCIYRRLAILIVSGKIKAKDINSSVSLFGRKRNFSLGKTHGQEWHFGMMKLIATYFQNLGYSVISEPSLSKGRADLGIYKSDKRNLFIEVGTISLSKLFFNLSSMKEADFLLVLDTKHAIEFSIIKATYARRITQEIHRKQ